jgi:hypothetical protein
MRRRVAPRGPAAERKRMNQQHAQARPLKQNLARKQTGARS